MKHIYSNIKIILLLSIITLGIASCSTDDFTEPKEAGLPLITNYVDDFKIEIDQSTNYVTFSFIGKGALPVWIIDGTYSTDQTITKYYRKAGNYSIDIKVANSNGISDAAITKTFRIDKTIMNGFGGFVYDSDFNLWKKATISKPEFYYAPGWNQINDPIYSYNDGAYNINLPEATTDTWQTQVKIGSDINTSVGTQYDFSVILSSTTDNTTVTIKLVDGSNDDIFYFTKIVSLAANEPICSWASAMEGIDASNLKLVVDFGGNQANTEVTIENIVFKNHANDDGTVVPDPEPEPEPEPNWVDVDSANNLWHGVVFTSEFYYAPGWNQIANPELVINSREYTLEFPEATTERWQNQVKFITESLTTTATQAYDFRVTIKVSNNISGVTIKFVQDGDDETYLFAKEADLQAGVETTVKVINTAGANISKAILIFDFGGNPTNTNVSIKDVILQEHKD